MNDSSKWEPTGAHLLRPRVRGLGRLVVFLFVNAIAPSPVTTMEQPADSNPLGHFALQCDTIAHIFSLISSISTGKRDQYALVCANSKGLRVSVENASKSCFASSYLNVSYEYIWGAAIDVVRTS